MYRRNPRASEEWSTLCQSGLGRRDCYWTGGAGISGWPLSGPASGTWASVGRGNRMNAVETFEIALGLLSLVIALTWTASRVGLPPATALLVGGGLLAFVPGLPPIGLDPDL